MTDLVAQLVGALDRLLAATDIDTVRMLLDDAPFDEARTALSAAKDGGWVAVQDCPDGDVWFALSCGHVVMGYKQGDLIIDWEAAIDHDCCSDASAIKAMPVAIPNPPRVEV